MKIKISELRRTISEEVAAARLEEARRAKKKGKSPEREKPPEEAAAFPREFERHPQSDLSAPQGPMNRYSRQGHANFGPLTSEQKFRALVGRMVREALRVRGR